MNRFAHGEKDYGSKKARDCEGFEKSERAPEKTTTGKMREEDAKVVAKRRKGDVTANARL